MSGPSNSWRNIAIKPTIHAFRTRFTEPNNYNFITVKRYVVLPMRSLDPQPAENIV